MKAPYKRAAIAVGIALPLCAALVYFALGNSRTPIHEPPPLHESKLDTLPSAPAPPTVPNPHEGLNTPPMQSKIEALSKRLKENPHEDLQSWITRARSYFLQGRFAQAASAYAEVVKRSPNDAHLLADYAETLALAQGRSLKGEPEKVIQRALAIDPKHFKALGIAGRAAFDRADYPAALKYWTRLLPLIPPESEYARKLGASIADAQARMSNGRAGPQPAAVPVAAAAAAHPADASR